MQRTTDSLRIALTGGIGSGKSTVATTLQALGAVLVDADAISRQLTQPGGTALPAIRDRFGGSLFDAVGHLDRVALRALVFADANAKAELEATLHPLIRTEALRQATAAAGHAIVFDIPLLVESTLWRASAHRVLVIDCGEDTQARRVGLRPGWDEPMARRVIAQQASRAQRRAIADAVIHNDGIDLPTLAAEVNQVWQSWRGVTVDRPGV